MSNSRFGNRTRTGNVQDWMVPSFFTYDADALAFINASGISNLTQKFAINFLTVGLKENGIWTSSTGIYPVVGGTAFSHKFNLKNPADTDAAFRLSFSAGWTHSDTGMTPNGTSAWADTFIVPSTDLSTDSIYVSYYSRSNVGESNTNALGCASPSPGFADRLGIRIRRATNKLAGLMSNATAADIIEYDNTDSLGFYVFTSVGTARAMYKNGVILSSVVTTSLGTQAPNVSISIAAENRSTGPVVFDNKECAFCAIGTQLTNSQAVSLNALVATYQKILNRNV